MTRGEAARTLGINQETIRYYEGIGLFEAEYNESGYRVYDENAISRLDLIIRFKKFGFSLKEIKRFLTLIESYLEEPAPFRDFVDSKIDDLDEQIRGLQEVKAALISFQTRKDKEGCALSDMPRPFW